MDERPIEQLPLAEALVRAREAEGTLAKVAKVLRVAPKPTLILERLQRLADSVDGREKELEKLRQRIAARP